MRLVMLATALCVVFASAGCATSMTGPRQMGNVETCPPWAKLLYQSRSYDGLLAEAEPDIVYSRALPPGQGESEEHFFIWAQAAGKQGPWTFKLGRVYRLARDGQVLWGLLALSNPDEPPPTETRLQFPGKYWVEAISYPGHKCPDGNHTCVKRLVADAEQGSVFEIAYMSDIAGPSYAEQACAFLIYLTPDGKSWALAAAGDFADSARVNGAFKEETRYEMEVVWLAPERRWPFEVKVTENVVWSETGEQAKLPNIHMTRDVMMTGPFPMRLQRGAEQYAVADGKESLRDLAETLAGYFAGLSDLSGGTQAVAVMQWQLELVRLNPRTDPSAPLPKDARILLPDLRIFGGAVRGAITGES